MLGDIGSLLCPKNLDLIILNKVNDSLRQLYSCLNLKATMWREPDQLAFAD